MADNSPLPPPNSIVDGYAGFTRFELELEFVQLLSNPFYLNYLASQLMLEHPAFIRYLHYLQYWSRPQFAQYLAYPGPTLRTLELLQQESFRKAILRPAVADQYAQETAVAKPAS